MRRAAALAVVLVMALSGIAQAASPMSTVTGNFSYLIFGQAGHIRTVSIDAQGTSPVRGAFSFTAVELGLTFTGSVTCLVVSGNEAWLAGRTTTSGVYWFMYLKDGGTPGAKGDQVSGWISDPGETLSLMESYCTGKVSSPYGLPAFDVVAGNLSIHLGRG